MRNLEIAQDAYKDDLAFVRQAVEEAKAKQGEEERKEDVGGNAEQSKGKGKCK